MQISIFAREDQYFWWVPPFMLVIFLSAPPQYIRFWKRGIALTRRLLTRFQAACETFVDANMHRAVWHSFPPEEKKKQNNKAHYFAFYADT